MFDGNLFRQQSTLNRKKQLPELYQNYHKEIVIVGQYYIISSQKFNWYDAPLIFTPTPTSKIFWASQIDIHPYRRHSRRTSRLDYARGIIDIDRHKTKSGSSGFW